ncbi:hypothetical protein SDC9_92491 [bioreactor metagenome]|uniref:Uncharacterized protein n=1 Tax=bioreactor metagenome TaxID=1076179 RepID=A0A644ZXW1_9ZZZZ
MGGADGRRLHEGESSVFQAPADEDAEVFSAAHRSPGDEGSTRSGRKSAEIEGVLHVAQGRGGCNASPGGGARVLSSRHAVVVVVHHHRREVHVPPGGVDQVVAPDGGSVAVAHEDHHGEFRVGELDPRGEGESPPVGPVEGVHRQVVVRPSPASDARDGGGLPAVQPEVGKGTGDGLQDEAVAAAGAPDSGQPVFREVFPTVPGRHDRASLRAERISPGGMRVPSTRLIPLTGMPKSLSRRTSPAA